MATRTVMLSLKLTDCLQNDLTILNEMSGLIENDPLVYSYRETENNALVRIEIHEDVIRLTREEDALTTINFIRNALGTFSIQDTVGSFGGEVMTLEQRQEPDCIYIHYRLYANDALVTEQKMELRVKEYPA